MRYLTDRKRAVGLGSGREGTQHHWKMLVSSVLLIVLVPLFICLFGMTLGGSFADVQSFFARPVPAIAMAICLVIGIRHFMMETHEAVEDYVHGTAGKLASIAVTAFSYTLIATALFALLKLALA